MHKLCPVQPGPPKSSKEQSLHIGALQTVPSLPAMAPVIHHLKKSLFSRQNGHTLGTENEKLDRHGTGATG